MGPSWAYELGEGEGGQLPPKNFQGRKFGQIFQLLNLAKNLGKYQSFICSLERANHAKIFFKQGQQPLFNSEAVRLKKIDILTTKVQVFLIFFLITSRWSTV
jgi:hypothetical protein